MGPILAVLAREGLDVDRILYDDHEETELEKSRGNWRPVMSKTAGQPTSRFGYRCSAIRQAYFADVMG